jgi:serine/threonine protein kinase
MKNQLIEVESSPSTACSSLETNSFITKDQELNELVTKHKEVLYDKRYRPIKKIGRSDWSKIILVQDETTSEKFIIKKASLFSNQKPLKSIENEAHFLSKVTSPYIIKFKEFCKNGQKKSLMNSSKLCHYILLEHASKGDIFNYVKTNTRLKPKIALYYFKQLIEAVAYLHKNNICHRDIKLENILLDDDFNLKLTDFEFCHNIRNENQEMLLLTDKLGSISYMAPEFFTPQRHPISRNFKIFHYGDKVDVFACGVVLFILLFGTFPFNCAEKFDEEFVHFYEKSYEKFWTQDRFKNIKIPTQAKNLLNKMWEPDLDKRITIEEIFRDEFFNSQCASQTEVKDYMSCIWSYFCIQE